MGVEHGGVDAVQGAVVAADGVVGDEDVDPPAERVGGRGDQLCRCGGVAGPVVDPRPRVAERGSHCGDGPRRSRCRRAC
ncbi:hypothetical protein ACFWY6_20260 [Streptomyces sp. NPDC059037]|uniref:hypothetical protein n=1 Tax=Streptomyces sp. NPDC059037 TaxID=3346710 RepID=UPI00368462C6